MLTCREVTELVTDYVEGRLGADDAERFRAHVAGCPHCTKYLEQLQAVARAAAHIPVPQPPPEIVGALARAFAERPPKERFTAGIIRMFGGAGGFALAAAIVVVVALHALLAGTRSAAGIGAWLPCVGMQLMAGGVTVALGGRMLRERAGPGGWAACAAIGGALSSLALTFMCPVEPTTEHLLVVHAGGVALAALLAAIARGVVVPVRARA